MHMQYSGLYHSWCNVADNCHSVYHVSEFEWSIRQLSTSAHWFEFCGPGWLTCLRVYQGEPGDGLISL